MELDDLKNIWQEENNRLANKIKLNQNLLLKMNMDTIADEFNQMVRKSLLGRNMALIYCLISMGLAILLIEEIAYSLPAMVGGLAMLWSFASHLIIEKPDYNGSLVQWQKTICSFRIHTAAHAKYDIIISVVWMLTFIPIFLHYVFNISIYNDFKSFSPYFLISVVVQIIIIVLSRKVYKEYDQKLKNAEAALAELIAFEKK
jgi:uncharacterized membrane protein